MGLDGPGSAGQELHEKPRQRFVGVVVATEGDARPVRIARQGRQAVQPPDHLHQRVLHVGPDPETQIEVGIFSLGIAFDLLYSGHALHDFLKRLEELRLDLLGRGGAPAGLDGQLGLFYVGEELQRQPVKAQ